MKSVQSGFATVNSSYFSFIGKWRPDDIDKSHVHTHGFIFYFFITVMVFGIIIQLYF
jgi:hypothetical protein